MSTIKRGVSSDSYQNLIFDRKMDWKGFIRKVRELGMLVKLDTNGSNYDALKELIDEGLVDYVAMDMNSGKFLSFSEPLFPYLENEDWDFPGSPMFGTSLAVQYLRLHTSTTGDSG